MISVGIDISKEKSMVCVMKSYGELVLEPFELIHDKEGINFLIKLIKNFKEEVKVVMEATGIYHLPILLPLVENKIFVSAINAYQMKKYRSLGLRRVKTDRIDSIAIANYGIDNWFKLLKFEKSTEIYSELKRLGREYKFFMKNRVEVLLHLTSLLDRSMPGIKKHIQGWDENTNKDKLLDFIKEFKHYNLIKKLNKDKFTNRYLKWVRKYHYQQNIEKSIRIYELASRSITTIPYNASFDITLNNTINILREVDNTLYSTLSQMKILSKSLPEYIIVESMRGIGKTLAPRLIAEIGDVRRFHSKKALIAFAGIDSPPFQSGTFTGANRAISKRGSSNLRKIGYEAMRCIKTTKDVNDPVYNFIIKKENEGKPKKVAKIAGLNKFLRIYYGKVKEIYN